MRHAEPRGHDRSLAMVMALVLVIGPALAGCTTTSDRSPGADEPRPTGPVSEASADGPAGSDAGTTTVQWRGGLARTGYVPNETVGDAVSLAWKMRGFNKWTHTAAKGSALIVDDTILVGADTGLLYRLSLDGDVLWATGTWPSQNGIHGTPAVHDGVVYIGAYDGALYAFDLETGEPVWRTALGGSIGASPLYHDGRILMAVETPKPSGILSVVNATDGSVVWQDDTLADHPHSSVALDPELGVFVVGANDGLLYAWDAESYERRWTFETDGAIKGPIALHDGAAFFGSWDHTVYRVELATGEATWTFETGGKVMSGAAIDPTTGTVYIGSHDRNVYALDAATGDELWRAGTGGRIISSPTIAGDKVLVTSQDERVYAFDKQTGEEAWRYAGFGMMTSSPAVHDGRVYVLDRADEGAGYLYVLTGSR